MFGVKKLKKRIEVLEADMERRHKRVAHLNQPKPPVHPSEFQP